jgi:hypothetical protein
MNVDTWTVKKDYLSELYMMRDELKNKKGVLIYFNTIPRKYLPSKDELERQLPLQVVREYKDGTIYRIR